jgi:hypothetical protein
MLESSKDGDAPDPDETPWRGGDFNGGPTEPSGSFPYRLVSMIRHVGPSAKSGHYVCDVWNPKTMNWKECVVLLAANCLHYLFSLCKSLCRCSCTLVSCACECPSRRTKSIRAAASQETRCSSPVQIRSPCVCCSHAAHMIAPGMMTRLFIRWQRLTCLGQPAVLVGRTSSSTASSRACPPRQADVTLTRLISTNSQRRHCT